MNLLIKWLVSAAALLLASVVFSSGIHISSLGTALIVAFFLGLLNALVRPILIILTLPITVFTLGLFIFVINALIFWFVAGFVDGFEVDGFLWALVGAVFVSAISWAMNQLIDRDKKKSGSSRRVSHTTKRDGEDDTSYYHVDEVKKPDDD